MVRAQLDDIPAGDAGLDVKLRRLRALVNNARADASFVQLARNVVRNVPERDYAGERAAVSAFVRRMRYTRDPAGVELFTDPRILAQQLASGAPAFGDCDDATGLACAMLEALGHPTRFAVGGAGRGNWSHIWAEVFDSTAGRWVPQDDTAKHKRAGWSPAPLFDSIRRERPAGRPMNNDRIPLPTDVDLLSLPPQLGGLGKLKVKKMRKLFVKSINPAAHLKLIGKNKLVRKALPVAAVVANVIPGVGQGVSAGLMVANAAVAKQRQQERMRAARQADAAAADTDAAAWSAQEAEQQAADAAQLMQQQAQAMQRVDAPDLLPNVVPGDYGDQRPWIDQATPPPDAWPADAGEGMGDWSSLLNAAAQYVPRVVEAAGSGAFGRKAAGYASRVQQLAPGLSASRALTSSTRQALTPGLVQGGGGGGAPAPDARRFQNRTSTQQQQPASLAKQHPYAFAAGAAALLFLASRFLR